MAFIKIDNVVINTTYIAAVVLDSKTHSGEEGISILIAVPKVPFQQKCANSKINHYSEWLEFTGDTARVLRDYFSSLNHVVDLATLSCHSAAR